MASIHDRRLAIATLAATLAACGQPVAIHGPRPAPPLERLPLPSDELRALPLRTISIDPRDGLSLDEATAIAVIANPELRALRAERDVAAAQVIEAGILPNPDLALGIDVPAFGATAGTITAAHAGLSWEVTSLVARDANVRASEAHARQIQLDVAWGEWQVAMEARLQWRRLAAIEQELIAAKATERDFKSVADTLEAALKTRDATAVEASASRSALDEATLARLALERARAKARRALARALGISLDAEIVLQGLDEATGEPGDRAALVEHIEDRRLDLAALRMGYASREEQVRAAVLSRVPRIAIDLGLARDTTDVGTAGVGLTIALPVFDRAQGRIAVATATRAQVREEYDARVVAARADLDEALADLQLAREGLVTAEATLPHLEQLVATYRAALAQHVVDVPSLYNALNTLNARRLDILRRREELGDLVTAIELASGQLATPTRSTP